jgi:hypothetical protein
MDRSTTRHGTVSAMVSAMVSAIGCGKMVF